MDLKPKNIVRINKKTGEVVGEGVNYQDGTCSVALGFLQGLGDASTENKPEYYNENNDQVEVNSGN